MLSQTTLKLAPFPSDPYYDYFSAVYVGGDFTTFSGSPRKHLVQISSSGSLGTPITNGTGLDGPVYALKLDSTNYSRYSGLYVGGAFTSIDGFARGRIARIAVDYPFDYGVLDPAFNVWADGPVRSLQTQGTGTYYSGPEKLLIGGDFQIVNGFAKIRIARLALTYLDSFSSSYSSNVAGNLETAFNPEPGVDGPVRAIGTLSDGRYLIGGGFAKVSGTAATSLARLYADFGSALPGTTTSLVVTTSTATQIILSWTAAANSTSHAIESSPDGIAWTQIATGGSPHTVSGLTPGTIYHYRVKGLNYNGAGPASNVVSKTTDLINWPGPGSLDPTATPGADGSVSALTVQTDGKILVAGSFRNIAGAPRKYIARLNPDLTLDTGFVPGTGPDGSVETVAVAPDGKVLIGGSFSKVNGVVRESIARLNSDGSLDPMFDPGVGPNGSVHTIAVQTDGKVLMGGSFSTVGGYSQDNIARMNNDGSLDFSFRTTASSTVYKIQLLADGRFLMAGSFYTVNGIDRPGIVRIHPDGSLDPSFNSGTGAYTIYDLCLQDDGKIVIGGSFSTYNGISRKYVARIDASGVLDPTFNPGTGPNSTVKSIAVDPAGNILIGGSFTSFAGTYRSRLARLSSIGALDPTFRTGLGFNSTVEDILVQDENRIVVGGDFTSFAGIGQQYIARLNAGTVLPLAITTTNPLPSGIAGSAYLKQMEATGGIPPLVWSITSGNLPAGLVMESSGQLHGTPTGNAGSAFHVRVTDASLAFAETSFTLNITDLPPGLVILEATYGIVGTTADVKSVIISNIVGGAVNLLVNAANLAVDPAPGLEKTLYVRYQDPTGHYATTVPDGGTLVLPGPLHQRLPMDFSQWASTRFSSGEMANPARSSPLADPDGDGVNNLLESAFGGDPHAADGASVSPAVSIVNGKLTFNFQCDANRSDLTYIVESSLNLGSWVEIARSNAGAATFPVSNLSTVTDPGTGLRQVTVTDAALTGGAERKLIRLKVVK